MAWNRIQAARLLSGKEMELFESSLSDKAPRLDGRQLGGHIRRVRTQRDKFQDLVRRQKVSTRDRSGTKSGTSGKANARTGDKVQLFSEALVRLEKEQRRRTRDESAEESGSRLTLRAAVKSAVRGKSGRPTSGPSSAGRSAKAPAKERATRSGRPPAPAQSPPEVPNAKRAKAMGQARTLAHVTSRGRRQQARRDSR